MNTAPDAENTSKAEAEISKKPPKKLVKRRAQRQQTLSTNETNTNDEQNNAPTKKIIPRKPRSEKRKIGKDSTYKVGRQVFTKRAYPMTRNFAKEIDTIIKIGEPYCMCSSSEEESDNPEQVQKVDSSTNCAYCGKMSWDVYRIQELHQIKLTNNETDVVTADREETFPGFANASTFTAFIPDSPLSAAVADSSPKSSDTSSLGQNKAVALSKNASASKSTGYPGDSLNSRRYEVPKALAQKTVAPNGRDLSMIDQEEVAITSECSIRRISTVSDTRTFNETRISDNQAEMVSVVKSEIDIKQDPEEEGFVQVTQKSRAVRKVTGPVVYTEEQIIQTAKKMLVSMEAEMIELLIKQEKSYKSSTNQIKIDGLQGLHGFSMKTMERIIIVQEELSEGKKKQIKRAVLSRMMLAKLKHKLERDGSGLPE